MRCYRRLLSTTFKDVVVVALAVFVPPTAKVIRRRNLGFKSHPNYYRRPGVESMNPGFKGEYM